MKKHQAFQFGMLAMKALAGVPGSSAGCPQRSTLADAVLEGATILVDGGNPRPALEHVGHSAALCQCISRTPSRG